MWLINWPQFFLLARNWRRVLNPFGNYLIFCYIRWDSQVSQIFRNFLHVLRDEEFERCSELFVLREVIVSDAVSVAIHYDDHIAKLKRLDCILWVLMEVFLHRQIVLRAPF